MRFRKVDPRIWNDAKFISLSDKGKLIFFMLLTHPNMTALGAMRASLMGLAEELGWPAEGFREAFGEVLGKGMAEHDPKSRIVTLPNFLRYNPPESPNVVKAWISSLDYIPECELKKVVILRAKQHVEGMGQGFVEALPKAFLEVLGKNMPNKEPEPEQEPEQEPEPEPEPRSSASRPATDPVDFLADWNRLVPFSQARAMTESRKKSLKERLKDSQWVENYKSAMVMIASSDFLRGANGGWKIDIDFFLRPDSVTKIIEGKYHDVGKPGKASKRIDPTEVAYQEAAAFASAPGPSHSGESS